MFRNSVSALDNDHDLISHPVVRWGVPLIIVAIGCLTLDITVRRTLLRELAAVRQELSGVESRLQSLVSVKDQAWETNDLLSALTAQKRQLDSARSALASVREFRRQVEIEAQNTGEAVAALDGIVKSQQLVREAGRDIEQTDVTLQKVANLQTKLLENSAGVESAQRNAAELIALKQTIQAVGDAEAAQQTAEQLVALRDSLHTDAKQTEQAQEQAAKLLALRDDLAKSASDTETAEQNWVALRKLEADMLGAGKGITDAIETLELLTDLSDELRMQSQVVAGVRRSLMDVAALETTVGRVMRVLEPLAELKNLSRMSEAEVRSAARAIIDQRTKLSRRDDPLTETSPSRPMLDANELEIEPNADRLVPQPLAPTEKAAPIE